MSEILIAVTRNVESDIEDFIECFNYQKEVKQGKAYFQFSYPNWSDPEDTFPGHIMTYLLSVLGMNNYAFIRLGEEVDDSEIHGNLEAFNIEFTRKVKY